MTSRRMIRTIVEIVDIDGDGEIEFDEFVTLLARVKVSPLRNPPVPCDVCINSFRPLDL